MCSEIRYSRHLGGKRFPIRLIVDSSLALQTMNGIDAAMQLSGFQPIDGYYKKGLQDSLLDTTSHVSTICLPKIIHTLPDLPGLPLHIHILYAIKDLRLSSK